MRVIKGDDTKEKTRLFYLEDARVHNRKTRLLSLPSYRDSQTLFILSEAQTNTERKG